MEVSYLNILFVTMALLKPTSFDDFILSTCHVYNIWSWFCSTFDSNLSTAALSEVQKISQPRILVPHYDRVRKDGLAIRESSPVPYWMYF